MVCSGAYPEGPRCPMLSTVESFLDTLSGAAPAVGAPSRTTRISMANERTIVTLDRCTIFPSRRSCPYGRGVACLFASRAKPLLAALSPCRKYGWLSDQAQATRRRWGCLVHEIPRTPYTRSSVKPPSGTIDASSALH